MTEITRACASGLLYLASLSFISAPALSATILLLGVGESFIITGGQSWGLATPASHAASG